MYINEIEKFISKDKIYINEPMSKHTSFKIGGPAECLIKIQTVEELKSILKFSKEKNQSIHYFSKYGTKMLASCSQH